VRDTDYVIVLADGEVIEEGSPDELILKQGWFADFAKAADEYAEEDEEAASDEERTDEVEEE